LELIRPIGRGLVLLERADNNFIGWINAHSGGVGEYHNRPPTSRARLLRLRFGRTIGSRRLRLAGEYHPGFAL